MGLVLGAHDGLRTQGEVVLEQVPYRDTVASGLDLCRLWRVEGCNRGRRDAYDARGTSLDATPTPLADLQVPETAKASEGDLGKPIYSGASRQTEGVEGLICAYPWPQGCDYWIGVARCESTLGEDPNAYADWNPYVGLFQIWIGHNYERGWLKDDANNVLAAWELSHEGTRTSPWPYCQ